MLFIRCTSHRARGRVLNVLGGRKSFYRWADASNKGIYQVTPEEYEAVKSIPGVSRMRDTGDIRPCW